MNIRPERKIEILYKSVNRDTYEAMIKKNNK